MTTKEKALEVIHNYTAKDVGDFGSYEGLLNHAKEALPHFWNKANRKELSNAIKALERMLSKERKNNCTVSHAHKHTEFIAALESCVPYGIHNQLDEELALVRGIVFSDHWQRLPNNGNVCKLFTLRGRKVMVRVRAFKQRTDVSYSQQRAFAFHLHLGYVSVYITEPRTNEWHGKEINIFNGYVK